VLLGLERACLSPSEALVEGIAVDRRQALRWKGMVFNVGGRG
jgi:hypothetical protein